MTPSLTPLRRERPAPPVRQLHLGLGSFFRAHQADYTDRADDGWGIAAFAGHSAALADQLSTQSGLYTLVERGDLEDECRLIASVSRAHRAHDPAWHAYFADPAVSVVTLTVTEAAYRVATHDDREALRHGAESAEVRTVAGRIVSGLISRRRSDAGPIALVPCDNLPGNGGVLCTAVLGLAEAVDASLAEWARRSVSFVGSLVDRITPATTTADIELLRAQTGRDDRCPVITERFSEWVFSDNFAGARPAWEDAGAVATDDLVPYERRKLWLLNGAHSLMAYTAVLRGSGTVDAAIRDPVVARWVTEWWDEVTPHLPFSAETLTHYRGALMTRFGNPRIEHQLAQIAADGSAKLPARVMPVLLLERAEGRMPIGAARVLAGWVLHLRGHGAPLHDRGAADLAGRIDQAPLEVAVWAALHSLDPTLSDDAALVKVIAELSRELSAG